MKKVKLVLLLSVLVASSAFSNDQAEVWTRMYRRAFTPDLKYSVMLSISELNDRAMIPLLEEILSEDIIAGFNNKKSITEQKQVNKITKLVVKELGELKATTSAPLVYDIVKLTDDPLLKADAIVALGNMRADKYLDDIAFILKNKNMRPLEGSSDAEAEAKVAYSCVAALDRFKAIEGYSPVFFASVGWYDQRVRFFADKVLKTIVENPVESLIPIIINGSTKDKEKALKEVATCKAPREDKNRAAREALNQGFVNLPENLNDGLTLTAIRKDAIKVLYANKSKDVEDVHLLAQSVTKGYDFEEKVYGIRTLAVNNTDEAIEALSKVLGDFNQRNVDGIGITYEEEDIVREIIDALGTSGKQSALAVLTEVQFSGYTNAIIRKAKEAISELNK